METFDLVNTAAITQRQQLRLAVATQILSGLVVDQNVIDSQSQEFAVNIAINLTDLLLKKITQPERQQ